MRDLPTGTVTFLFTDIEGSTRLLRELGDAYADVLADHRRQLRAAFAAHAGVEVDTQGDAFFVAFRRASDAAAAASEAQLAVAGGPIRVRIGIHAGEPNVTDEGYVGIDVHRAARVMGAAHGGQILLSERARSLLTDDRRLRDLGVHRLKDLGEPERLYQLGDEQFPPLRTLDATNLPLAAGPLLGRKRELDELVSLLADQSRLLTITGPGGSGKTRLALQVAAELVGRFRDGVFWVPLGGVSDPELVVPELAQTVGAPEDLTGFLRGRELLVLLDNLEHLLAAGPALVDLLATAKGLQLLVTSRAPLRVSGEQRYPLEPLEAEDAVTLFVERARAVGGAATANDTAAAICRRLDHLPLAIELAAARTRLLGGETLLRRLDRALPLLTGGARDAPGRQQTLRATIEWSHDLLDEQARALFERLGVFAGSFPLEAAEDVCAADLDALGALVDLSLLKAIGEDRLLLLETIREYALERLSTSDGERELRRRHATFFTELAEHAYEGRHEAEAEWASRLELDHDDLRAALEWLAGDEPGRELELAGALSWFWVSHSHLAEGSRRLDDAIRRTVPAGRAGARALTGAGAIAGQQGNPETARRLLEEGVALWRGLGDAAETASALDVLGWMHFFNGENDAGLAAFEESLGLRRAALDRAGETRTLVGVCQLLVARHDVERAEELSSTLLDLARADEDARSEHFACHFLADCSLIQGDYERAEERYRESLRAALPLGDVLETSFEVQGLAMTSAARGDSLRAATLGGAVEALWEAHGIGISIPFWDALLAEHIGGARNRLGESGDSAWEDGRRLSFEDAIELALN